MNVNLFSEFEPDQRLNFCWGRSKWTNAIYPVNVRQFLALVNSEQAQHAAARLASIPHDAEHKNERDIIKQGLPVFCFTADEFAHDQRCADNAHSNGLGMIDIDDADPVAMYQQMGGDEAMKRAGVVVFHHSISGQGAHIVFKLYAGESIPEAQKRVCRELNVNVPIDPAVKNRAGLSFIVPASHFIYLDANELIYKACSKTEKATPEVEAPVVATDVQPVSQNAMSASAFEYDGVSVKDIENEVMAELVRPQTTPSEDSHNRHDCYVKKVGYMCHVADNDPDLLYRTLENWGLPEKECRDICISLCHENLTKPMPQKLRDIITRLQQKQLMAQKSSVQDELDKHPLPAQLLPFYNQLLQFFPAEYRKQVIVASLGWLGTLTTSLRYNYDGLHPLSTSFLIYVVGHMASGKSFTRILDELLMTPLREEDQKAAEAYAEWKNEKEACGNQRAPRRPHLIQRTVQADFTEPALKQQIIDSHRQHCHLFSEESDEIRNTLSISALLRKAHDNSVIGQTRVGAQAVTGSAPCLLNVVLCGTYKPYFRLVNASENGLGSRFIVVPMQSTIGRRAPKYHAVSQKVRDAVMATVNRLHDIGRIDIHQNIQVTDPERQTPADQEFIQSGHEEVQIKRMPMLERRIDEFVESVNIEYQESKNIAPDVLSNRIPDIIRRAGMVFYALEGMHETKRGVDLAIWVGEEVLQNMLNLFGKQFDDEYRQQQSLQQEYQRQGHNVKVLAALTADFTVQDVDDKRREMGLSEGTEKDIACAYTAISRWKKDHLITADPDRKGLWHKVFA